jgi:hypothetical protein
MIMLENLAPYITWSIVAIAFFSWLSVSSWASARQREREAYYKSEAIKKIAEMQGVTSEPVLQVLRETLANDNAAALGALRHMGPIQTKAYYRAETIKKIAEMQGAGAEAVLTVLREEDRTSARRTREGLKLAGLVTSATGIGLAIFLRPMVPEQPVYLSGFLVTFVGIALLVSGYALAPKD